MFKFTTFCLISLDMYVTRNCKKWNPKLAGLIGLLVGLLWFINDFIFTIVSVLGVIFIMCFFYIPVQVLLPVSLYKENDNLLSRTYKRLDEYMFNKKKS